MEFGLDHAAANRSATRFELSRHVEIARTCSNLVADRFEAKFHYANLVADRSEAGRRPVADLLARASSLLASYLIGQTPARCRSATSLGPVCDQDSVMEFGLSMNFTNRITLIPPDTASSVRNVLRYQKALHPVTKDH